MAGGQERILRGRIRSVQATKKITRAMELIAASRIVKAQQRVAAAVPYSEQITEVVKDLAAAGGASQSPLLAGRGEVQDHCYVVITADRGLCGGYNAGVQRAAEGEIKADVLAGKRLRGRRRRPQGRGLLPFRGYKIAAVLRRLQRQPHLRRTPVPIGEDVVEPFLAGEFDRVELVYTRFICAGSQEVVLRPLVPLERETVAGWRRQGPRRRRHPRRLRVRAGPRHHPRHAAAALRRGPHLRRAAQRRGQRARLPPAGDEERHRQRRGTDQEPQPHHEPRPPGQHHHRDHGDRQRCRGPRRRVEASPPRRARPARRRRIHAQYPRH